MATAWLHVDVLLRYVWALDAELCLNCIHYIMCCHHLMHLVFPNAFVFIVLNMFINFYVVKCMQFEMSGVRSYVKYWKLCFAFQKLKQLFFLYLHRWSEVSVTSTAGREAKGQTKVTSPTGTPSGPSALKPSEPTQVVAAIVSTRFITLSWNHPERTGGSAVEGYNVYWREKGSDR